MRQDTTRGKRPAAAASRGGLLIDKAVPIPRATKTSPKRKPAPPHTPIRIETARCGVVAGPARLRTEAGLTRQTPFHPNSPEESKRPAILHSSRRLATAKTVRVGEIWNELHDRSPLRNSLPTARLPSSFLGQSNKRSYSRLTRLLFFTTGAGSTASFKSLEYPELIRKFTCSISFSL